VTTAAPFVKLRVAFSLTMQALCGSVDSSLHHFITSSQHHAFGYEASPMAVELSTFDLLLWTKSKMSHL
jgi:hypothetical protein